VEFVDAFVPTASVIVQFFQAHEKKVFAFAGVMKKGQILEVVEVRVTPMYQNLHRLCFSFFYRFVPTPSASPDSDQTPPKTSTFKSVRTDAYKATHLYDLNSTGSVTLKTVPPQSEDGFIERFQFLASMSENACINVSGPVLSFGDSITSTFDGSSKVPVVIGHGDDNLKVFLIGPFEDAFRASIDASRGLKMLQQIKKFLQIF
jgi:hypothetical protein